MARKILIGLVVFLVLCGIATILYNPIERRKENRDDQRTEDLNNLKKAIDFYITKNAKAGAPLCNNCSLGTDVFTYRLLKFQSFETKEIKSQVVNGHGWVPVDLALNVALFETPLQLLPIDPLEKTYPVRQNFPFIKNYYPEEKESFVYTYTPGASGKFKLTAKMESKKGLEKAKADGGSIDNRYEIGELTLRP